MRELLHLTVQIIAIVFMTFVCGYILYKSFAEFGVIGGCLVVIGASATTYLTWPKSAE